MNIFGTRFWRVLAPACAGWLAAAALAHAAEAPADFPLPLGAYGDAEAGLWEQLRGRIAAAPINLVATVIFLLAIMHTFAAVKFQRLAHAAEHTHEERVARLRRAGLLADGRREPVSFRAVMLHFLGEVEAVFGIWLVPLFAAVTFYFVGEYGLGGAWARVTGYVGTVNYDEPLFVVVIMAVASTRPVIVLSGTVLRQVARLGGESPAAWWLSILTIAPLLGSFITEPAAMTIAALLLSRQFYALNPSRALKYATLGLLFVNVSVGGTLTHFAAPPVLMVAGKWGWTMPYMLEHFGLEAAIGIVVSNALYFAFFRREFAELGRAWRARRGGADAAAAEQVPWWVTAAHLFFLAWSVMNIHHPPLLLGGFLFFLAFTQATAHHQDDLALRSPLLVGFFLAALVTHGGLQTWWIQPVLGSLGETSLFLGATILTAFNDNAAITFLASLSPEFATGQPGAQLLQHAVMQGAVTGGGLTVIANAPNPAGQSILSKHFGDGISPLWLAAGALVPTVILGLSFRLLGAIF